MYICGVYQNMDYNIISIESRLKTTPTLSDVHN